MIASSVSCAKSSELDIKSNPVLAHILGRKQDMTSAYHIDANAAFAIYKALAPAVGSCEERLRPWRILLSELVL